MAFVLALPPTPQMPNQPPQPCVVFDVDGTLTGTTGVDDACLVGAWEQVLGARNVETDWSKYAHSTDEGLTLEVCQKTLGRGPTRDEVARVKDTFFRLLRERIAGDRASCVAVRGAPDLIGAVRAKGWRIGIASGAWEESARIKLAAAGMGDVVDGLPGTFSHARQSAAAEPGLPVTREEIVTGTLVKLGRWSGGRNAAAVYVGDGVWDAKAARALNIGFVGVRIDGREERLRAQGAERIVHDYSDLARVLEMIEQETA